MLNITSFSRISRISFLFIHSFRHFLSSNPPLNLPLVRQLAPRKPPGRPKGSRDGRPRCRHLQPAGVCERGPGSSPRSSSALPSVLPRARPCHELPGPANLATAAVAAASSDAAAASPPLPTLGAVAAIHGLGLAAVPCFPATLPGSSPPADGQRLLPAQLGHFSQRQQKQLELKQQRALVLQQEQQQQQQQALLHHHFQQQQQRAQAQRCLLLQLLLLQRTQALSSPGPGQPSQSQPPQLFPGLPRPAPAPLPGLLTQLPAAAAGIWAAPPLPASASLGLAAAGGVWPLHHGLCQHGPAPAPVTSNGGDGYAARSCSLQESGRAGPSITGALHRPI